VVSFHVGVASLHPPAGDVHWETMESHIQMILNHLNKKVFGAYDYSYAPVLKVIGLCL
jgi:hypothetical protein